jgi:ABC-type sugar transport system ATPase subunit
MRERTARELAQLHARIPNIGARCKDLSGGQRQALAIARASAWCDRVLLLDEPTSALGVEQHREVLDLIRRVRDLGAAVILVSHQMPDVLMVCDRITVLRLGSVVAAVEREKVSADDLIGYITGSKLGPGPDGGGPPGAGPDGGWPAGGGPAGGGPGGTGPARDTPAAPGPAETGGE